MEGHEDVDDVGSSDVVERKMDPATRLANRTVVSGYYAQSSEPPSSADLAKIRFRNQFNRMNEMKRQRQQQQQQQQQQAQQAQQHRQAMAGYGVGHNSAAVSTMDSYSAASMSSMPVMPSLPTMPSMPTMAPISIGPYSRPYAPPPQATSSHSSPLMPMSSPTPSLSRPFAPPTTPFAPTVAAAPATAATTAMSAIQTPLRPSPTPGQTSGSDSLFGRVGPGSAVPLSQPPQASSSARSDEQASQLIRIILQKLSKQDWSKIFAVLPTICHD